MSTFSKEQRQEIVREFAVRHNGLFDPKLFLEEVRAKGEEHVAHSWFEWDAGKAAAAYQLEQAREFARDLRIRFEVEEIVREKPVKVRSVEMPMVQSPRNGRSSGGGYVLVDPNDPEHHRELAEQALTAFRAWFNRYQAAVLQAGIPQAMIDDIVERLEKFSPTKNEAA